MLKLESGMIFAERYSLLQCVHTGGQSSVWTATDHLAQDALVAVKIFAPDTGLTEDDLKVFRRDTVTVVPLNHPALVKPLHFDVSGNLPFIVLPYYAHGSLADHSAREKSQPFSEAQLAQLIEEIGGALAYLHGLMPPMLHIGLSPADILITDDGHFLLADFWRSRDFTAALAQRNNAYAPPEALTATPEISYAGDIYSLGLMLYELATGTALCSGKSGQLLSRGAEMPDLPTHLSAGFRELIHRCLEADPELRPSAPELVRWAKWYRQEHQSTHILPAGASRSRFPLSPSNMPMQPARRFLLPGAGLGLLLVGLFLVMHHLLPSGSNARINLSAITDSQIILRLHGSNTIGSELAPALVEAYFRKLGAFGIFRIPQKEDEVLIRAMVKGQSKPQAIEICAHGSTTAFEDLAKVGSGNCDIGMASRRVKKEEQAALQALGDMTAPTCEHVLALDGIAVIVQAQNPVTALSKEAIAKIFAGEITDWAAVGRKSAPIHVYARDDKSGTFDTFKNLVLGSKRKLMAKAERFESNEQLREVVADDPDGIGFVSISFVKGVKALAVSDGPKAVSPSTFTVATEDYPLSRRLYFYTPAQTNNQRVQEFIEFALSKDGQDIASQIGFVGQNLVAVPTASEQRLNFNFRFQSASIHLDNKAQNDIGRLVSLLRDSRFAGRTVLLYGYADNRGDEAVNRLLSQQRAQAVASELKARNIARILVKGFGAANPVASNETADGRDRNRRVEVWIK